ncbi:MAG: sugar transferase [Oscillospiraceae bacterium]|nr:sugar transferase [Oscillospiraceae bacterium]
MAATTQEIRFLQDFANKKEKITVETIEAPKGKRLYFFAKRVFDIVLSAVLLIVLLIPMLLLSAVVAIETRANPIYRQVRLGKDGKPFVLLKFRSMRKDAEKDGAQWAAQDDPRITRFGKVLRGFRIDELPQLLNILVGDMSFVGPRPERPEFYDVFDTYIDGYRQRMYVLPGLTGHAQVNGGYELQPEEKILYDIEYIKNCSCGFDIRCLLRTVATVFFSKGAR